MGLKMRLRQSMVVKQVNIEKVSLKPNSIHTITCLQIKKMKFPTMTMIIRSAFEEDDKLNPQIYLDDSLYEL